MLRRVMRYGVWALGAFAIVGCTETTSLFSSLDESPAVAFDTVVDGAVVRAGDPIAVAIDDEDDPAVPISLIQVRLIDSAGSSVTFESDALDGPGASALEISTDGLPEGGYTLSLDAFRGSALAVEDRRGIFLVEQEPRIDALSLFPSSVDPTSETVAIAEVHASAAHRPYGRWVIGDETYRDGYLEDGLARVVIPAGDRPGVAEIRFELLPWGPDEGVAVDAATAVAQEADLFVRGSGVVAAASPSATSDLVRYAFDGSLRPNADSVGAEDAAVAGTAPVGLDVVAGVLGYRIDPGGYLRVPSGVVLRNGGATRLDVELVLPPEYAGPVAALASASGAGDLALLLSRTDDGEFRLDAPIEFSNPPTDDASVTDDDPAEAETPPELEPSAPEPVPPQTVPAGDPTVEDTSDAGSDGVQFGHEDPFDGRLERISVILRLAGDAVTAIVVVDGTSRATTTVAASPTGDGPDGSVDRGPVYDGSITLGGGSSSILVSQLELHRVPAEEFLRAELEATQRYVEALGGERMVGWLELGDSAPSDTAPVPDDVDILLAGGPGFALHPGQGGDQPEVSFRVSSGALRVTRGETERTVSIPEDVPVAIRLIPGDEFVAAPLNSTDAPYTRVAVILPDSAGRAAAPLPDGDHAVIAFLER